ncbi:MAG: hypothetical protein O7D97_06815, partial [Planctomycetota bacterium]|nr:hypothetical protein [Planctomycetota bacterium]
GQAADEILLAADFALVLEAGDLTSAQETLQQLVTELGPRAALVRNFSYEEARRLEQEWLLSRVRRPGTDPAEVTASIDGRRTCDRPAAQPSGVSRSGAQAARCPAA